LCKNSLVYVENI